MNEIRMVKFDGSNYVLGRFLEKSEKFDSLIQWESREATSFGVPLSTFRRPFNILDENIQPIVRNGVLHYPPIEAFVFGESQSAQSRVRSFWDLGQDEVWDFSELVISMAQDFQIDGIPINDLENLMMDSYKLSSEEYGHFISEFVGYCSLLLINSRHGEELRFFLRSSIRSLTRTGFEVLKEFYHPDDVNTILNEIPKDRILKAKSISA